MIDEAFDPLIARDNLAAANAEVAAARLVIASGTASKAAIRDARETLNSAGKDQAEYLLRLAEAGRTGSKAYATGVESLRTMIKEASGPTKKYLQGVLDKLLEIERTGKKVPINFVMSYSGKPIPERAAGGPVTAGRPYIVGDGGRPELFVPNQSGTILPSVPTGMGGAAGGGSPVVIQLQLDGRTVASVVDRHLYYAAARAPLSSLAG